MGGGFILPEEESEIKLDHEFGCEPWAVTEISRRKYSVNSPLITNGETDTIIITGKMRDDTKVRLELIDTNSRHELSTDETVLIIVLNPNRHRIVKITMEIKV